MLAAIRSTTHDGATGFIKLDEDGNNMGSYQVRNVLAGGEENIVAGTLGVEGFTWTSAPIFNDGTTDVPRDRACSTADYSFAVTECDEAKGFKTLTYEWENVCSEIGFGAIQLPATKSDVPCGFVPNGR